MIEFATLFFLACCAYELRKIRECLEKSRGPNNDR